MLKATTPLFFYNDRSRLLFEILIGVIFYSLFSFTLYADKPYVWEALIFTICIFVSISEGIFAFNKLLSRKYSWHDESPLRFILLIGFSAFWFSFVAFLAYQFKPLFEKKAELNEANFALSLVMALLFIAMYVVLLIAHNYHQSLGAFRIENERLKQEKLKADYRALQDQVNPHFLFNNLSTLIAIIRQDQKAAIRFAENFSDVYRYVLESKNNVSIKLHDELIFINSYLALHKERLGKGLDLVLDVSEALYSKHLPPLSLQFLVENAIKHNIATEERPLVLEIVGHNDSLNVTNTINLKKSTYSTNTGLSNLKQRMSFLTDRKVEIKQSENKFSVELPLI